MKSVRIFSLLFLVFTASFIGRSQSPVALNDTIHLYKFDDTLTINVLANDYDPDGDPITIFTTQGALSHTDSTITYVFPYELYWNKTGLQFFKYYVTQDNHNNYSDPVGEIYVYFHNIYFDSLDINQVSARINNNGNHFWNCDGDPKYFVPKTTGQSALFSFGFIAGGIDDSGQLHLAGQRYDDINEMDYWPGPVMDSSLYSNSEDSAWNRLWKLNRTDIEYHQQHWWQSGYQMNPVIAQWPGNGDPALGQAEQLAPYHDLDANGIYNPGSGDYPIIKGDQCVFFIMNDTRRQHTQTGGKKMGLEIHGMAYAFDCTMDSALMYTTFLHYDVYNRSANTYHNAYFGTFVDTDLGYSWDDYVASDVKRGSFLTYNGRNMDGTGQAGEYGAFPPAISATILAGPFMDPDNLDNPSHDNLGNPLCDSSVNGFGFGDNLIDNERLGMQSYIYTNNCGSGPTCDPQFAFQYYRSIKGQWLDSTVMVYGVSLGVPCRYMYPGLSDPCNWGTYGVQPPGFQTGAGGTGLIWNEELYGNPPDDRRGISGMGPFTFTAGSMQQLDLAFVWARQYTDSAATAVIPLLGQRIDQIRSYFFQDSTPCGSVFSGMNNHKPSNPELKLYPNPAGQSLFVDYKSVSTFVDYTIYNIVGEKISFGKLAPASVSTIRINTLQPGFYVLTVSDNGNTSTARFIKK